MGTISEKSDMYVLIGGLPSIQTQVTLARGIVLRPINDPISVYDLAAIGLSGFREWSVLEPVVWSCNAEIVSESEQTEQRGYDTLNRAWLMSALLVMRGYERCFPLACNSYSWSIVAGHQNRGGGALPQFHGRLLDFHLQYMTTGNSKPSTIEQFDIDWIAKFYAVTNRLAHENRAFRFALESAYDWRFAKEPRSAVARLWSGIEAVINVDAELTFRLSLSVACLLKERGQKRRIAFKSIKELYGLRSRIVHGSEVKEDQLVRAVRDSFLVLRDLLVLSIERGSAISRADIDTAIFD